MSRSAAPWHAGFFYDDKQPLELDALGVNLGKVIVRLLREPAFGTASENRREPHGDLGRNAVLRWHIYAGTSTYVEYEWG